MSTSVTASPTTGSAASPATTSAASPRNGTHSVFEDLDDEGYDSLADTLVQTAHPSPKSLVSSSQQPSPQSQAVKAGTEIHPHAYRTAPLPFQDTRTFVERRDQVLHRRQDQHHEFVSHIVAKWRTEEDLRLAREQAEREARLNEEALSLSRLEAWCAPLLLALHFKRAFEATAEELRATNNLRFFLLPLCVLYVRRMRKKLRLRHALAAERAKGSTKLERPSATTLKLSSPMLSRWPEAALEALASGMQPRMYEEGDSIFLKGEYARSSYVHFLVRGLITVPDPTESHESSNGHSEVMLFELTRRARTDPHAMHSITSGTLLGEFGAFVGEKFRNTYTCRCDCIVYSIEAQTFLALVSQLPPSVFTFVSTMAKNRFKRRVLNDRPTPEMVRNSHPFFASWPNDPISSLLEAGSPSVFRVQERIFRDSRTTNRLFFIISGTVATELRHGDKGSARSGAMLGTESIVPVVMPSLKGELAATADTFVETWAFPRPETMNIMHRFSLTHMVLNECARVVYPQLPQWTADAIRRANVFNFLPDKPAMRLAELFKPMVVLPDTILVRQETIVTDLLMVVWGTVQLFTTESRTRERKIVGELHPGVTFGAAEVVAQAVSNVSVIATNATIVATVSKAAVYSAIELGGKNLLVAVLDRANQLVGSRSAEARARLEEEVRAARAAMERDQNPQQQIDDALARCAARIREVRAAQRDAAEQLQSREALEQKAVIARLTADARRARELQKLTVEHRVFACIKAQVYGGARHEHTELVSQYYATPFDHDEPVFVAEDEDPALSPDVKVSAADRVIHHRATGRVAVTAPEGPITFTEYDDATVAEDVPRTQAQAAVASPGWAADSLKSGLVMDPVMTAPPPTATKAAQPAMITEGPKSPIPPAPNALPTSPPVQARATSPLSELQVKKDVLRSAIRDPLPDLKAPPTPRKQPVVTELSKQQLERANAIALVEQRSRERREQYAREYAALFSTRPPAIMPPPEADDPPHRANSAVEPLPPITKRSLPAPSRLRPASEAGAHRNRSPIRSSDQRDGPSDVTSRSQHHTMSLAHPSTAYPDMRITVDPTKSGRSVGAVTVTKGHVSKGRPEGRIFAQTARLPPTTM